MYRVWSRVMPLITKGNWLDKAVLWKKPLLAKATELIVKHNIRSVLVTGAPFGLMAHASELKKRFPTVRLIADFRDPWTWGHYYGQTLLSKERQEQEQEQEATVARTFDKLISPAPAIIDHLRGTYGGDGSRYVLVPHAIDPDELDVSVDRPIDGIFRMIYAGSLYGAQEAEAYFEELLNAFENLRNSSPEAFKKVLLDLYITGHDTSAYRAKVTARGLDEHIRFHKPLPAKEIFPHIAAADLVLIFIPSPNKDFLGTFASRLAKSAT